MRRPRCLPPPLARSFFDRDVVRVARDSLGKLLIRVTPEGTAIGRIVEVEAYRGADDPASHAYRGQTARNASMFGPPGHAYVYAIHSRWCLNVVTGSEGVASAVLVRAIEPLEGIDLMQQRRSVRRRAEERACVVRDLARGPARLCEALGIDRALDGWDLTRGRLLWIARGPDAGPAPRIVASARIGISAARELQWRFFLADTPFVSKARLRP